MTAENEPTKEMRSLSLVLVGLAAGLLVGGVVGAAPAAATTQDEACADVLANGSNATAGPGGELAEAIGDQRSELGSELDDRWFEARLANATSDEERASIVATELERIEVHLEAVEACWERHESASEAGDEEAQLDSQEIERLDQQARSLHERVNATASVAANLSATDRERHGIGDESIDELERRVESLREAITLESEEPSAGDSPFARR